MNNIDSLSRAVKGKDAALSPETQQLRRGHHGENIPTISGEFWHSVQSAIERVGTNTFVDILSASHLGLLVAQSVEANCKRQLQPAPIGSESQYLDSLIASLQTRRSTLG